jgi:hypothetical protein
MLSLSKHELVEAGAARGIGAFGASSFDKLRMTSSSRAALFFVMLSLSKHELVEA